MLSSDEIEEHNYQRFEKRYEELADLFCAVLAYVDHNYAAVPEIEEGVSGFTDFRKRYYDTYTERLKQAKQKRYAEAMAKLTDEDRKVLGLKL